MINQEERKQKPKTMTMTIQNKRTMSMLALAGGLLMSACSGGGSSDGGSEKASNEKKEKDQKADQKADQKMKKDLYAAHIEEMGKKDYPDNPNWGYTAKEYGSFDYDSVRLKRNEGLSFDMSLRSANDSGPSIELEGVDLSIYTPRAPEWVRSDEYLTYIGVVNQEWNRQQVRFSHKHFEVKGDDPLADSITRVDVARNCLNAGLWEVIAYKNEGGQERPVYHGWFDMPTPLYSEMFREANDTTYKAFRKPLEKWVEPENKTVDLSTLRKVKKEWSVDFENRNDELYPLKGSRKKKYKNIIRPEEPETIQEMLTDSTLYATFDQPGFYNTKNPRKTQLGKLAQPQEAKLRKVDPAPLNAHRYEIDMRFLHNDGEEETRLVISGLDLDSIPTLPEEKMNQGFKMPMGIANHSFYESYEQAQKSPVGKNPYFGMLIDGDGKWLDSHKVGIDGPLFFWDQEDPKVLHFLILSFERHAFVGHYELKMPEKVMKELQA